MYVVLNEVSPGIYFKIMFGCVYACTNLYYKKNKTMINSIIYKWYKKSF